MKKIALFGGAFNPITTAHIAVAMAVHTQTGMPVWVLPSYKHQFGKDMASEYDRHNMCVYALSKWFPLFKTFDYEIENKYEGSTYELLKNFQLEYPDTQFHFVIGMDNVYNITKWKNWKELTKEIPLLLIGRQGWDTISFIGAHPETKHIELSFPGLSSSDIRKAIEEGNYQLAKQNLDPNVWDYIVDNKLYGYK